MVNYHTHTYRCKHAVGDVVDFAAEAVKGGCTVLGMSDHTPFPDGRWDRYRMDPDEMGGYIDAIEAARGEFPGLTILQALECEYDRHLADYFIELKETWSLDYLIGGVHWVPHRGEWINMRKVDSSATLRSYVDYTVATMESGLFAFLAHPDSFGYGYLLWDKETEAASKDILTAAAELKVPLEINGYGFLKDRLKTPRGERPPYPLSEFWELATQYDVTVTVNADAHDPEELFPALEAPMELAQKCGLKISDPVNR